MMYHVLPSNVHDKETNEKMHCRNTRTGQNSNPEHSQRKANTLTPNQSQLLTTLYKRPFENIVLRTKSVTKKEMNKCMAEIYDPGRIRTRAARLISQYHNH